MIGIGTRWRMASLTVRRRVAAGVSLIELIAVAIVLAVFALIVVPNVVHSLDLAKSNMLKTQIATVQEASDSYYAQTDTYPAYCQPSSTVPGCELNWGAGDPFVPDFLHTSPSASPAAYGLTPSNGVVVYWGVDQNGTVFATQTPPNMNDPDGWSPLPTPRWEQNTTVTQTAVAPTTDTVALSTTNTIIHSTAGVGTGSGQWTPDGSGGLGVSMASGVSYSQNGHAGMVYQAPAGNTISQVTFTGVAYVGSTSIANPAVYVRSSTSGPWVVAWSNIASTSTTSATPVALDGSVTVTVPSGTVQVLLGNQLFAGSWTDAIAWSTVFQSPTATVTTASTATLATCTAVTGMPGCQMPSGSTATATSPGTTDGYYGTQTPNLAIDGNVTTYWSAGALSGTLTVTYPSGVAMTGLYVNTVAGPASSSESYTVSVLDNGQWISEGTTTELIGTSQATYFIPLPAGTYDGVRLAVDGGSSWVEIYEITTDPAS